MKVLILGVDGYLGWPTALHFSARGHQVVGIDNGAKRRWEASTIAHPLMPLPQMPERVRTWNKICLSHGFPLVSFEHLDIAEDYDGLVQLIEATKPDAIIHYAEQPSAPFSMANRTNAVETQVNNVVGTLNVIYAMRAVAPDCHLVKLGTMGEYGTPNIDIEEGWLELEHKGRRDRVLYPKKPHSMYHLSKVHDSANLEFACRVWKMRVTDLNQGVVYGIETDETAMGHGLHTSFHYDGVFGTVINRFMVQAVLGMPLTVYGSGQQTRGILNIRDTLRCVELATLNPAEKGEFRVFNQITEQFSMIDLANMVAKAATAVGFPVEISHVANPRVEQEAHYYNVVHSGLRNLGLEPHLLTDAVLRDMIEKVAREDGAIDIRAIPPTIGWQNGTSEEAAASATGPRLVRAVS